MQLHQEQYFTVKAKIQGKKKKSIFLHYLQKSSSHALQAFNNFASNFVHLLTSNFKSNQAESLGLGYQFKTDGIFVTQHFQLLILLNL